MCSFLLERGAGLFQETTQQRTPLDFAIFGMNKDVIDMLCPDVTLLERRDSEGCTALLRHCLRHENDKALALEVAKQLVHLGADVKVKDKQQRNALHGAASQLNLALAKWLVDMGVQPHEEDAQGMTPFRYFAHIESWRFSNDPARHEQVEGIYKYLRSLTSDEQVNEVFCSPVKRAWIMTDESLRRRQTLLSAALEAENWTISNLLFQEGAVCPAEKINDPTWLAHGLGIANNQRQKVTFAHLLHSVAPEHRYGLFTVDGGFIGSDIMKHGKERQRGHDDDYAAILATLSESGIRAEPTALQKAFEWQAPNSIVRALISFHSGAYIDECNSGSHDILLMAALAGDLENFVYVLNHMISCPNTKGRPWWFDVGHGTCFESMETVAECIAEDLHRNSATEIRDKDGMTPLLRATLCNNVIMVRALLQHGADIDAQEPSAKWNALLLAVYRGCVDVVNVLLEFGSDPNIRPEYGLIDWMRGCPRALRVWNGAPIIVAASLARNIGKNDIVLALLSHGADVNARADQYDSSGFFEHIGRETTALAAAFERVNAERPFAHQNGFSADRIRSVAHKAVGERLPAELTDEIADVLIADLTSNKQTRELVKMLIEHGADPTGVANGANLQKISMFAGGYEELWDDHLRLGIDEGKERVYEFDPTL